MKFAVRPGVLTICAPIPQPLPPNLQHGLGNAKMESFGRCSPRGKVLEVAVLWCGKAGGRSSSLSSCISQRMDNRKALMQKCQRKASTRVERQRSK
jgi:hypothetical protein